MRGVCHIEVILFFGVAHMVEELFHYGIVGKTCNCLVITLRGYSPGPANWDEGAVYCNGPLYFCPEFEFMEMSQMPQPYEVFVKCGTCAPYAESPPYNVNLSVSAEYLLHYALIHTSFFAYARDGAVGEVEGGVIVEHYEIVSVVREMPERMLVHSPSVEEEDGLFVAVYFCVGLHFMQFVRDVFYK